MNKAQFLAALRKTPRDWRIKDNDDLRRGEYETFCPITAVIVARKQECVDENDAAEVGKAELRLPASLAALIVKAADNDLTGHWSEPLTAKEAAKITALRSEMLSACGVKKSK